MKKIHPCDEHAAPICDRITVICVDCDRKLVLHPDQLREDYECPCGGELGLVIVHGEEAS